MWLGNKVTPEDYLYLTMRLCVVNNTSDYENRLLLESYPEKPISTNTSAESHVISIVFSSTVTQDMLKPDDVLQTETQFIESLDDAEEDMDDLVRSSLEDWDE